VRAEAQLELRSHRDQPVPLPPAAAQRSPRNPTRRYQTLRSMDGAPCLPSGYASMIGLTYFPPLWRKVMDHRVMAPLRRRHQKVNVHPRVRDKVIAKYGPQAGPPSNARLRLRLRRAKGAPREGFPAGTKWDDVPDDWCCPDCSVREKIDFDEIGAMK